VLGSEPLEASDSCRSNDQGPVNDQIPKRPIKPLGYVVCFRLSIFNHLSATTVAMHFNSMAIGEGSDNTSTVVLQG
jgi:hypothetical protein